MPTAEPTHPASRAAMGMTPHTKKRTEAFIRPSKWAGVWRCHTQFNCTAVCPKGITLTDSIVRLKRLMLRPGAIEKMGGPR